MSHVLRIICLSITLVAAASPGAAKAESAPVDQHKNQENSENSENPENSQESDDNSDDHSVKTVVSSHRELEDRRFPSGHVSRVRLDERAQTGEDLGDALKEVAGVSVRRTAGIASPAFASVRGGNPRQLAVSLNGLRIGAPVGVGFDVGSLSLVGLDAADIYKGPAGVVQGSGALSGALELRSELPRDPGFDLSVDASAGSFSTASLGLRSTLVEPDFATRISAGWRSTAGDFDFIDPQGVAHQRQNNARWQFGLSGAGRKSITHHDFSALLLYETSAGGEPGPSEFQAYYKDAQFAQDRLIAQLAWERADLMQGDWGALDMRAAAGFQRRATDYESTGGYPLTGEIHNLSGLHTLGLSIESDLWLWFDDLLHAQVEVRRETYDDDNQTEYPASFERAGHDAARLTLAGALSNELLLFDEALSLTAAIRAEYIDDNASHTQFLTDASQVDQNLPERHWTPVIPALGAIWRATDWLQLKANLAWTFRPPDLDELYLNLPGIRGDLDLEPERARAWDLGAQVGRENGPATLNLAWFHSRLQESIHFIARTAYLFEAANLGPGTSRGVEASGTLRPHSSASFRAHYTWTDAHLDAMGPGTPIPGQPEHQAGALASWQITGRQGVFRRDGSLKTRIFARADWRSPIFLDTFGNVHNADFMTVDAGLSASPTPWLLLTFNARNLADNQRGADILQRPMPGRSFYLSARFQLD